jgi:hypothetical protein
MANLVERVATLSLAIALIVLARGNSNRALASEVNLDILCRDFPQNSRCKDYKVPSTTENNEEENLQPKDNNNKPNEEEANVIKLNVSATGGGEEWVRIEREGNRVKLLHTAPTVSGISKAMGTVVGFFGVPFPDTHEWNDHKTTRIVFQPDNCSSNSSSGFSQPNTSPQTASNLATSSSSCEITGEDTIDLPENIDITQGRFTVNYTDGEASVERSISFKVPAEEVKKASK